MTVQHRAKVDADGNLLGFYPSDIFPIAPEGAVDITDQQYFIWLNGQAISPNIFYRLIDGQLVVTDPPPPSVDTKNT